MFLMFFVAWLISLWLPFRGGGISNKTFFFVVSPRFELNEKIFIKTCFFLPVSRGTKYEHVWNHHISTIMSPPHVSGPWTNQFFQVIKNPLPHPQGGPLLVVFRVLSRFIGVKKPQLPKYLRPFIGAGPMSPPTSFQVSPSNLAKRRACRLGWVQTSRRHTHLKWCLNKSCSDALR